MFYKTRFERPFPVSYLLIERLTELLKSAEEGGRSTEDCISLAMIEVLQIESPSVEDMEYVLQRLDSLSRIGVDASAEDRQEQRKTFGSQFMVWLRSLSPASLCLYAAGFDMDKAEKYYCRWDQDDVLELARLKMEHEWERAVVEYESVLYGMGGSYKGDKGNKGGDSEGVRVFDLTKDDKAGMQALKELKF